MPRAVRAAVILAALFSAIAAQPSQARSKADPKGVRDDSSALISSALGNSGVVTGMAYVGDTSGRYDNTARLSAYLFEWATGAPVKGRDVYFDITNDDDLESVVVAKTDATGLASATMRIAFPAGEYFADAVFYGDGVYQGAWDWDYFDIDNRPATLTYQGPEQAPHGAVTVSARLSDSATAIAVAGKTLMLAITDGTSVLSSGTGTTSSIGVASATLQVPEGSGTLGVSMSFSGDGFYKAASAVSTLVVQKQATILTYTGPSTGLHGDDASLSARLTKPGGGGLGGRQVTFKLTDSAGSTTTRAATTAPDGTGTAVVPLGQSSSLGDGSVEVSFSGSAGYEPSSKMGLFRIDPRPTVIVYEGPGSMVRGTTVNLTARLTDGAGGGAVPGQPVRFRAGSFDQTASTNASGVATVPFSATAPYGQLSLEVSFAGSSTRLGDTKTPQLSIVWEATFDDEGGGGTVRINSFTKEFQFERQGETVPIKTDPNMRVDAVGANDRVVSVAFNDSDIALAGQFQTKGELTPSFFAVGRTTGGPFAFRRFAP